MDEEDNESIASFDQISRLHSQDASMNDDHSEEPDVIAVNGVAHGGSQQ